ncbi:hypothetical protein ACLOJK_039291 [Asimina triloba]
MGVKGLTLYHLKSHLQPLISGAFLNSSAGVSLLVMKFRLGKQPHKEFNDHAVKDGEGIVAFDMNVHVSEALRMQMEVQRRLHEQLEVQKHLQLRIEAQGKYMQSILEKACQTLAGENLSSGGYKAVGGNQDFGPPINFPPLQDLHLYGSGEQLDMGMLPPNDSLCLGNKGPNPYACSSKSSLNWHDDLRLQELGTAAACLSSQDDAFKGDQLQMAPSGITDMDSMGDVYESKMMLSVDHAMNEKKFEGSPKLERPSPRRVPISMERNNPMMKCGGLTPTRNLSYG